MLKALEVKRRWFIIVRQKLGRVPVMMGRRDQVEIS
jgi:hypothetical protein